MKSKIVFTMVVFLVICAASSIVVRADCCVVPDNGGGTADLPPAGCSYQGPMMIVDGLPPGTTIDVNETLWNFGNIVRYPGGPLGGEVVTFSAIEKMDMTGTGGLAGWRRTLTILNVQCQIHNGPRNPGDPVQSFPTDFFMLQGQLPPGDPDFDLLRITAGTGFGLPSPGHTTLTRQPDGKWNVDSFFDITYRIDFVGAPGGPLAGRSGSTTATIRKKTGCPASQSGGGTDCYYVRCGASRINFSQNPIPADFFGPGSDPFMGVVAFDGGNRLGTDVKIERSRDFYLPGIGSMDTVPIEIVALSLISAPPITVKVDGNDTYWNVNVTPSDVPAPLGSMTANKTYPNGGTFTANLPVQAKLTFTRVNELSEVRVLDLAWNLSTSGPYNWQDTSPKQNPPCNGNGFYVISDVVVMLSAYGDVIEMRPPRQETKSPHIGFDTAEHFNSAIENGLIEAMTLEEWQAYYVQLQNYRIEGPPYPHHRFPGSRVYVYDPKCLTICSGRVDELPKPSTAGLVLVSLGDGQEGVSDSIAFKYRYQDDPDLSNVSINTTVLPPSWINVVSLGMQDINGNIRAWYWNIGPAAGPGTLQYGVPTNISINTLLMGIGAASPAAASFVNNPAFDITQVSQINFDENGTWVASQMVPPPGETIPRMWNYWYDLTVTPNHTLKLTDPIKWSQPAVEYCAPGVFKGWDEPSLRNYPPLLADDWVCTDDRPITDIHWWGSFVGWMEPNLPVQRPIAFHFGIWTDAPSDPCHYKTFSHPNMLIWEYTCYDYQWNFAGYDKDPRPAGATIATTTGSVLASFATLTAATPISVVQPTIYDSCFQFYQKLPEWAWFHQQLGPCPCCKNVYWLSISAIYPPYGGMPVQYPWGWKTRPHYYNDDAVRVYKVRSGNWPPQIGDSWGDGVPVKYPYCTSWDMAFELTTNRRCDQMPPSADLNKDGIVNLFDLAMLASQWLTVEQ